MSNPYHPNERQIDVKRGTAPVADYNNVRDHFEREMRRVEQEMSRLRSDFESYNSKSSVAGGDSPRPAGPQIRSSPRVSEGGKRYVDQDYHYQQEQQQPRHSPRRGTQQDYYYEDSNTTSRRGGGGGRNGSASGKINNTSVQYSTPQRSVNHYPSYPFYQLQSNKKPTQRGEALGVNTGTNHYITTMTTRSDGGRHPRDPVRGNEGGEPNGQAIRVYDPEPYYPPATPAVYPSHTVDQRGHNYRTSDQRSSNTTQSRASPRQHQQIAVQESDQSKQRSAPYDAYQFGGSPVTSPLIRDDSDGRYLRLRFDVGQYNPDEVSVKTIDNRLTVYAKHEEKSSGKSVFREYNQEFLLPRGTDPGQIRSILATDGVLTVEAPLHAPASDKYPAIRSSRGGGGGGGGSIRYVPEENQRSIRYK